MGSASAFSNFYRTLLIEIEYKHLFHSVYLNIDRNTPAVMTEPITPSRLEMTCRK